MKLIVSFDIGDDAKLDAGQLVLSALTTVGPSPTASFASWAASRLHSLIAVRHRRSDERQAETS